MPASSRMRVSQKVLRLLILVISVLVLPAGSLSAASVPGKPSTAAVPRSAPPDSNPASILAIALHDKLSVAAIDTYAGVAYTSGGDLNVYATDGSGVLGVVDRTTNEVRRSHPGKQFRPVRVVGGKQHSLRTLEQTRDLITRSHDQLSGRGIAIAEWGVDIEGNRTRIGIENPTPGMVSHLEQEFGADRISVVAVASWKATTRQADGIPWWGGIEMHPPGDPSYCSSAFPMLKDNTKYLLTAAHCGPSGSWWYNNGQYIGSMDFRELRRYGDGDVALVWTHDAEGRIYDSPDTSASVGTYAPSQSPGEQICHSGATTQWVNCSGVILRTGQCITFDFGPLCGLVVGAGQTLPGDSGGPVLNYNDDGRVNVRGNIVGANPSRNEWAYTPIHIAIRITRAGVLAGP